MSRGIAPVGIKFCSSAQRLRTPPAFAQWLIEVASRCARPAAQGREAMA